MTLHVSVLYENVDNGDYDEQLFSLWLSLYSPQYVWHLVFSIHTIVFSILHTSGQWVIRNVYSYNVCVCHLKWKYHLVKSEHCFEGKLCKRSVGFSILGVSFEISV